MSEEEHKHVLAWQVTTRQGGGNKFPFCTCGKVRFGGTNWYDFDTAWQRSSGEWNGFVRDIIFKDRTLDPKDAQIEKWVVQWARRSGKIEFERRINNTWADKHLLPAKVTSGEQLKAEGYTKETWSGRHAWRSNVTGGLYIRSPNSSNMFDLIQEDEVPQDATSPATPLTKENLMELDSYNGYQVGTVQLVDGTVGQVYDVEGNAVLWQSDVFNNVEVDGVVTVYARDPALKAAKDKVDAVLKHIFQV